MLSPALRAMSQTVIDKTWTKTKDCMGVEGGTEERRDWSEAGRAEVSLEGARVKQVTVNEFHGRLKGHPYEGREETSRGAENFSEGGARPGFCFQLELFLAPASALACKG